MNVDFLNELNETQRQAVECTEGPLAIIAGAGSGKTRVLTYRVAYLIAKGIDPFSILALTFTNKAAAEMKERIIHLVGGTDAKNVWMGTFHSIFAKILRIEGERLGYPHNFTIYDADDSKNVMKNIIKEYNLDDKVYKPSYISNRVSAAKNGLISPEDYERNTEILSRDKAAGKQEIVNLYKAYNNRCRKASAMDFDDLLFNMNVLLRDFSDILYKYQHKFKYILVDEYQDTNFAQYMILKKLAAVRENICVVGDDAQSIYSFRGADIENILSFKSDYSTAITIKLEQNYRSTQNIVKAANSIIVKNKNQIFKEIWTENDIGEKIHLIKANSDSEEATFIANSIFETKMNRQLPNYAFAVLYRTNAQSRALEESLRRMNIPYRIYGGLSFYKRKEIKDLLAYFRLTINHNDDEAFMRVINYPQRGIGKTTLEKLVVVANEAGKSYWETIKNLPEYKTGLNFGVIKKLDDFTTMIESFTAQMLKMNAFDIAKHIANSTGIIRDLTAEMIPENISRFENIEELLNAIKEFCEAEDVTGIEEAEVNSIRTLDKFMEDVALLTDSDKDDPEDNDKVSLMTVHAAKGLEFPYVYITGLEENLFPSIHSSSTRADIEEERRLFYVALTRAKERATLSYCQSRYKWGDLTFCEPSRFIDEIDSNYIEYAQKKSVFNNNPTKTIKKSLGDEWRSDSKGSLTSNETKSLPVKKNLKKINELNQSPSNSEYSQADIIDICEGMEVEHQRFGKGKVIALEGANSNRKATVLFNVVGEKQLLLKFAKLKVL